MRVENGNGALQSVGEKVQQTLRELNPTDVQIRPYAERLWTIRRHQGNLVPAPERDLQNGKVLFALDQMLKRK